MSHLEIFPYLLILINLFNSGMSSIKPVPPLKIRLMPFSTKFTSNSKAYIAFSISIGSAFVLLCLEAVPQLVLVLKISLLFGFKALFAFLILRISNC
jgi:hypothetical protein